MQKSDFGVKGDCLSHPGLARPLECFLGAASLELAGVSFPRSWTANLRQEKPKRESEQAPATSIPSEASTD